MSARVWLGICAIAALVVPAHSDVRLADPDDVQVERRLAEAAQYLSSDDLEGRGLGTRGIELAAADLARRFRELGLQTDLCQGGPFQEFTVVTGSSMGDDNALAVTAPAEGERPGAKSTFLAGRDFTPMSASDSLAFDLPLVFVGFGVTDGAADYDDYESVDVAGKAVIIMRQVPAPPASMPQKKAIASRHARLRHKVANAYEHGAAAVILCASQADLRNREKHDDGLPALGLAGFRSEHPGLPVIYCRRAVIEAAVRQSLGRTLDELEDGIARDYEPYSGELLGWRIAGRTDVDRVETVAKNVIGMLPSNGKAPHETIVVGAHYDHFGVVEYDADGGKQRDIYHGADDNASGVSGLLEIAHFLASQPQRPDRNVVFVAFSAEEAGFLGSMHYVAHPVVPLARTATMVNLDMIGRLRDNKLLIRGSFTGAGYRELLEGLNKEHGFDLDLPLEYGRSDQLSFYAHKVPILHFFTGKHEDYHEPSDRFEKLNIPGMRRIVEMAQETVLTLANAPARPQYLAVVVPDERDPYLGVFGDFTSKEVGYAVGPVDQAGPAAKAGLQEGDVVVQFGRAKIGNSYDMGVALTHYVGGERVPVTVKRGSQKRLMHIVLEPPRSRNIVRAITAK